MQGEEPPPPPPALAEVMGLNKTFVRDPGTNTDALRTLKLRGRHLLWLFISGITIEIVAYLLSRELEVDLSRSDMDDHVGSVEERSSKDDGVCRLLLHPCPEP